MKRVFDVFLLVGVWITTVILLGALARVSWSLLNIGWRLVP